MRIGVSFSGFAPLASSFSLARAAEDAGFDSAWYCEHLGFHDAIVPAAVMLDRHPGLDVGVVGPAPVSRHPAVLAMELASLSEIAPGRVRAQLGLGDARLIGRIGGVANSLALVREYVSATRRVLAGEALDGVHANHVFDTFQTMPAAAPPELDIMAIRPKMLALAAEIADGVSLSTGASLEYLHETVRVIEEALRAHGRPRETFRITAQALGALGDTDEDAVARVAPTFMIFSPQILSILAPGLDPATDVARMAIAGTATTVAERLAQYQDAGIDEVAIDFAHDPDEAVDVIAAFGRARP
jgi:Coenzyme F420-dependent N5,N10-methylene tetrahydromethanopterin reductase and related flavin-dependent oxidoreductases